MLSDERFDELINEVLTLRSSNTRKKIPVVFKQKK